jgi:hypothetical protein
VVTVRVEVAALPLLGVTEEGEAEQVESAGRPLHVSATGEL